MQETRADALHTDADTDMLDGFVLVKPRAFAGHLSLKAQHFQRLRGGYHGDLVCRRAIVATGRTFGTMSSRPSRTNGPIAIINDAVMGHPAALGLASVVRN